MRKILITGHMGYIGSNLWEYFKYDPHYQINGIDFPIDLSTMTDLPDADYVIHLAASTGVRESIENPQEYFDNNVLGTKSIFNRYGCTNTKILFASTSAVKELASPYAMSKYACELIAPWNCVIMRFFTVYGGINYRKNMLYGLEGTLVLWPGIAEELVASKAWFVRDGYFDDIDFCIFTHVGSNLGVSYGLARGTGLISVEYIFGTNNIIIEIFLWSFYTFSNSC